MKTINPQIQLIKKIIHQLLDNGHKEFNQVLMLKNFLLLTLLE